MVRQPTSRTCFICGRGNDFGLKMIWYNNLEVNKVEVTVTIHKKTDELKGSPPVLGGLKV